MKKMKKLFLFLCIVIMFFGIAGCPWDSDPPTNTIKSSVGDSPQVVDDSSDGDGASPIPEPNTLVPLGSGLIVIAGIRRKFKK